MTARGTWLWAAGFAAVSWTVEAQAPSPSPSPTPPRPGETSLQQATPPVGPRTGMAAARTTPAAEAPSRHEGSLEGVKALEIADGKARLVLGGSERVVTPGTLIGTDTVKSITPGRMVLKRVASDAEGGDAIVIVTFDVQGRTCVQVFASKDPTTRIPAEVK